MYWCLDLFPACVEHQSHRPTRRPKRKFDRTAKNIGNILGQESSGPHRKRLGWSERVIPGLETIFPLLSDSPTRKSHQQRNSIFPGVVGIAQCIEHSHMAS